MALGKLSTDLKRVEQRIREWIPRLDVSLTGSREQAVAAGLGHRARLLHRGVIHACTGPSMTSAEIVLRGLVDLVIVARWIELSPELHVAMWLADDDRQRLTLGSQWEQMHRRRGRDPDAAFTDEQAERMRSESAKVRAKARAAGEPIGEKKSTSLLPTLAQMTEAAPDLFEVYQVAYRGLSPSSHTAARSFIADTVERRGDAWYIKPGAPYPADHIRALAASTMLFAIATIARQLGMGDLANEADECRAEFTRWDSKGES